MKKTVLFFLLLFHGVHADISSRHFLLPENTWELSPRLIDSDHVTTIDEYLSIRYGINDKIEFILPVGIKYLAFNGPTDKLALLAFISSLGYGSMNGWTYQLVAGAAWRHLEGERTRIDITPFYSQQVSDTHHKDILTLSLAATYTLSSDWEIGAGITGEISQETVHYDTETPYEYTEDSQIAKGSLFLYYYFSDTFDVKTGFHKGRETIQSKGELGAVPFDYDRSDDFESFTLRLDWRF